MAYRHRVDELQKLAGDMINEPMIDHPRNQMPGPSGMSPRSQSQ